MDSILHRDLRSQHLRHRLDRPNTTKRKMKVLISVHQLVLFYNYFTRWMVLPSTQFLYIDCHCPTGESPKGEQVGEGGVGGNAVGVPVVLSGVVGTRVE